MVQSPNFVSGWRDLSFEDRGLLLTFGIGAESASWLSASQVAVALGVNESRVNAFIAAAVRAGVLTVNNCGLVKLVDPTNDLRRSWERRFHEVFWPAVTPPWKKLGRVNALKVWMSSTFALINPKTEAGADALCETIMGGVQRYKRLLGQPNAPSMKYPQGWLNDQRWTDEIDDEFIAQHAENPVQPGTLNPLERARRRQSEQRASTVNPAAAPTERPNELAPPEFTVSL